MTPPASQPSSPLLPPTWLQQLCPPPLITTFTIYNQTLLHTLWQEQDGNQQEDADLATDSSSLRKKRSKQQQSEDFIDVVKKMLAAQQKDLGENAAFARSIISQMDMVDKRYQCAMRIEVLQVIESFHVHPPDLKLILKILQIIHHNTIQHLCLTKEPCSTRVHRAQVILI